MRFDRLPDERILVQEMVDEVCLMRLDTHEVVVLNRTATDVWLLLSDGVDVDRAASTLAQAYGLPADELAAQVQSVADELCRHGFLSTVV